MIGLIFSTVLSAADPYAYKCDLEDTACWREAALKQEERAERAEARLKLETSVREVAEHMTAEEIKRGDRWKETAMAVAPTAPRFYETPVFWGLIGVVVGAGATVALAYAVAPASR